MTKILWITSFDNLLYNCTGKKCVDTFTQYKIPGDLFVGYEKFNFSTKIGNIIPYNLEQDSFLQQWLEKNKDIIPYYLGGLAKECSCFKNSYGKNHIKGCHFSPWNRNVSRWFRKIVCYQYILNNIFDNYDYLIWLDCDCAFLQKIPISIIKGLFNNKSIFYMLGRRKIEETGFIGYRINKEGKYFLEKYIWFYTSGKFKNYERWDDSSMFQQTRLSTQIKGNDIVNKKGKAHVMQMSLIAPFISHFKGHHNKQIKQLRMQKYVEIKKTL